LGAGPPVSGCFLHPGLPVGGHWACRAPRTIPLLALSTSKGGGVPTAPVRSRHLCLQWYASCHRRSPPRRPPPQLTASLLPLHVGLHCALSSRARPSPSSSIHRPHRGRAKSASKPLVTTSTAATARPRASEPSSDAAAPALRSYRPSSAIGEAILHPSSPLHRRTAPSLA
jgi:hypothetical protein